MTGEADDSGKRHDHAAELARIEQLIASDAREALSAARQALGAVDRSAEPRRAAALLTLLGRILGMLDEHAEAIPVLGEAAALCRAHGNPGGLAMALCGLGAAEFRRGLLAAALDRFEEAERLALAAGDRVVVVRALNAMAAVHATLRDHAEAIRMYRQAIDTGRVLGTVAELVIPCCNLAQTHIIKVWESDPDDYTAADIDAAWAALDEARAGLGDSGHGPYRMGTLSILAQCQNLRGDAAAALETCAELLADAVRQRIVSLQACAHREMASALLLLGRDVEAAAAARQAVEQFRQISFVHETTFPLKTLALAEERLGNLAAALQAQRQYQETRWRVTREATERHANFVKARSELERAQAEAALHRRLAAELEAKNRELVEAKAAAEAGRDAKGAFLSMMGHELRSPLQAILGFSSVIESRLYGDGAIERYAVAAADIHTAGQHLLKLINQILDYSKGELGKLRLEEGNVELALLVESAVTMIADKAGRAGVQVEAALDSELWLRADELKLTQCLLNTLSNAVKFTPPGGLVRLSVEFSPEQVSIRIADSGTGIAPEDLAKVFEPFGQGRNAVGREGTGLGVPLSKMLMELHGGTLEIESAPGRGTIVWLRLPRSRVIESPETPPGPGHGLRGKVGSEAG